MAQTCEDFGFRPHSTGYDLANRNHDTRLVQDYLGHKNLAHTVRYTRTAACRFQGLWR